MKILFSNLTYVTDTWVFVPLEMGLGLKTPVLSKL